MRVFWLLCSLCLMILLTVSDVNAAGGSAAHPTRLHVTRTILPGYHLDPLEVTVQDEAAVQRLYQAAYKLEPVPPGAIFFCPIDYDLVYTLDFFQGEREVQQMHLKATGCRFLTIGSDDDRFATEDFNALVARTIGIPSLTPPLR